jgi:glycosyltransferase involved in cell wall biosynthesis
MIMKYVSLNLRLTIVPVKGIHSRFTRILWEHSILPLMCCKYRLDVLHCTSYITPSWKIRIPYVVTIHDTIALDFPQWCKTLNVYYFNLTMRRTTSLASAIICVSKYTSANVIQHFSPSPSKVHTIYPGIDSIFQSKQDDTLRSKIRTKYRLPGQFLLYVGNIEPKKNIKGLFQLFSELKKHGYPHKLVLVGSRTWKSEFELRHMNASSDILSIGYIARQELPHVYQMADAFIFPSLCEGFGFPPLEAMACGTPVISSCQGALGETMTDAAVIINPKDMEESRKSIESVLYDSEHRSQVILAGINRVGHFSWAITAQRTLEVYREVVKLNVA